MKNGVGASLPEDLWTWYNQVGPHFPGGKSGLLKDALRFYKEKHPDLPTGPKAGGEAE